MRISFFGAARMVTGSCYLIEHENSKFLVDCGLFQGNKATKQHNYGDFPFSPGELDFVLLTHAHIDHSGLIPKLVKQGFRGAIHTTSATTALCEIMLPDSAYIQESEIIRKNRKLARNGQPLLEPIYTVADAEAAQGLFVSHEYNEDFSPSAGISIFFRDAGHIFGSAMIEINYFEQGEKRKLVFTGDLGRNDQFIVRDPYLVRNADYLVTESTYGNRLHQANMEEEVPHFVQIIKETIARNGNVVIPAFAVDRTQDILYMLNDLQKLGQIPIVPVYLDSPLAIRATEIFAQHPKYYDRLTTKLFNQKGQPPFILDNLIYSRTSAESQRLNNVKGSIIISASGMADAGRIKHHLKHNLWRQESSVVFFGYQAEGTLGRRLVDGETRVTIHGEQIEVKASVYSMEGFSAHADLNEIRGWLREFEQMPRKVFVVHGEESAAENLAKVIFDEFATSAEAPHLGDYFDLAEPAPKAYSTGITATPQIDDNLLIEINTLLQKTIMLQDSDRLLRIRDYLKQLSNGDAHGK